MISLNPLRLNRCDWFLIFFLMYYLQGILYPSGGVISLGFLSVNLVVSLFYTLRVIQMRDIPVYFRGLNIFLVLVSVYGIALIATSPATIYYPISGASVTSYNYLKYVWISLLPVYTFYYFARKGYLTEERLRVWGFLFLASTVVSYFHMQQETLKLVAKMGSDAKEVTNNAGYIFLSNIPLLVVYRRKPLLQFALLAFSLAFIVMGMKRGAILLGGLSAVYFMRQAIRNSSGKYRFLFVAMSVMLCIGAVMFFIHMMNTSEYMMQRINATMEGNSSGRDKLYSHFWNYFIHEADILQFFIGRGANGTMEIYKNYAHNDWLELAVNQGLLGIVCYVFYWRCFYKTWRHTVDEKAKVIIAMTMIIYFAKTLFSMSYGDMDYITTSTLGYALATMYPSEPEIESDNPES